MVAVRNWVFQNKESGLPKQPIEDVLLQDLRDNGAAFVRSLGALSFLLRLSPSLMERAEAAIGEIIRAAESARPSLGTLRRVSYADVGEVREAAVLDISLYGEGRSIDQIAESIYANGFPRGRTGQVRSSINARGNLGVFFAVDEEDKVRLLPRGQELARELRARYGIT